MSLVRIAARIALCEALKDATEAGANVHDSLIGGIQVDAEGNINISPDEKREFITVFTDTSVVEPDQGRPLYDGGPTEIVIEWGISEAMGGLDEQTKETFVAAGIPATDSAFEFKLDLIGAQITAALNNPRNQWAEIFRRIASGGYTKVERRRASHQRPEGGDRLAAQQMRLTTGLMDEPVPGETLPEPFPQLFALLAASDDATMAARGALMEATLTGSDEPWEALARRFGLTRAEIDALGLGPLPVGAAAAADFEQGTIEIEGRDPQEVTA